MKFYLFLFIVLVNSVLHSQTLDSLYHKADAFNQKYASKFYYGVDEIYDIPNSHLFWYKTLTPKGRAYLIIDPVGKTTQSAFDRKLLTDALKSNFNVIVDSLNLALVNVKFKNNLDSLYFKLENYNYACNLRNYSLFRSEQKSNKHEYWGKVFKEDAKNKIKSPNRKFLAYIDSFNLWIEDLTTQQKTQLSRDGTAKSYYSSNIYWSPDSKKIVCCKYNSVNVRKLLLIDSSPDHQLQPLTLEFDYPKPGDSLPVREPFVFSLDSALPLQIQVPGIEHQFDLNQIEWNKSSTEFSFHFNERGHQRYIIYTVNADNGDLRTLVEEKSNTFVYYNNLYNYKFEKADQMLWISERDGWRHLYLYNTKTGEQIRQLTKGEWIVKRVIRVDEKNEFVLITVCGKTKGEDPYLEKIYKLDIKSGALTCLTPENANHQVKFSYDYKYMTDFFSRADLEPNLVVRRVSDGKIVYVPENQPDISEALAAGWRMPEVFVAKGRDGETDIWGMIIRPTDFDPNKKYPVIEYIYAGPHDSFVPKNFAISGRTSALSELGFITVLIDGMGTANRSKAFHDVCWKNLKDAGFPDRIAWMKEAARKYPEMDLERVGIYGGSAGGQSSTGALLFYPEFYKVAVSSCGCHDNRMDKIWWNEQWMGYPVGKEYEESSNVVNAEKLQGKLMLILGELDNNVDPSSTIQLVDKLVKYNKDFEFVMLPGAGHTLGESFGERKRRDFFVRWLQ